MPTHSPVSQRLTGTLLEVNAQLWVHRLLCLVHVTFLTGRALLTLVGVVGAPPARALVTLKEDLAALVSMLTPGRFALDLGHITAPF